MKNNNRLYNLLAAGSLTLLLGLTFLLFRSSAIKGVTGVNASELPTATASSGLNRADTITAATTNAQGNAVVQTSLVPKSALTDLQTQNAELVQLLQVMQERERQYQQQLTAANQALQTLQAQVDTPGSELSAEGNTRQKARETWEEEGEFDHDN